MKRPIRRLRVSGDKGAVRASVLFDSGSSSSAVRGEIARPVAILHRLPKPIPIHLAVDAASTETRDWVALDVTLDGKCLRGWFAVVEALRSPVVVGADLMDVWDAHLHLRAGAISIGVGADGAQRG